MKIGVVTTSYPREEGDPAGAFVAGFACWLVGRGASVEVIAAGPGAATVDGLRVDRVDGRGLFYAGGAPEALAAGAWLRAASFQAALAARVASRCRRWDAAVSHWLAPSGLATALALPTTTRHLAIAHSSDVALLRRSKMGRAAMRYIAARADLVYSARHLVVDGAPGRVVAMGIEPASGDRARGRVRHGLRGITALFLGRLVPVKGVDLLIDALPDGLDLIVAGDGPCRRELERRAARLGDRVRFVGEVRGEAKGDLLAAADLFALPSRTLDDGRSEGAPTAVMEALAAGLPVVATRAGGAAELIDEGRTGLLVGPAVEPLRAALARLTSDAALRERLATSGRARGREHGWPVVGPRLAGRLLDPRQVRNRLHTA